MCIVVMKIIGACRDRFFLRFQPEKIAEGLLLFIQGLGLGKTSILYFRLGQTILKLNDSFKAKLCLVQVADLARRL